MPSYASDYKPTYNTINDLPGAKLGEHLHHIFAGIKSRTSTPVTSRNNSVAPSRAQSPVRETARAKTVPATTASSTSEATALPKMESGVRSGATTRSSSRAEGVKKFSERGYYAF